MDHSQYYTVYYDNLHNSALIVAPNMVGLVEKAHAESNRRLDRMHVGTRHDCHNYVHDLKTANSHLQQIEPYLPTIDALINQALAAT